MTVKEYLKILNNISESDELTTESLTFFEPVIDVFPMVENVSAAGACKFEIKSEKLIISRWFILKDGSRAYVEKATPLSDNIELHCGKLGTPENVIRETINRLQMMDESNRRIEKITGKPERNYRPIIEKFEESLGSISKIQLH